MAFVSDPIIRQLTLFLVSRFCLLALVKPFVTGYWVSHQVRHRSWFTTVGRPLGGCASACRLRRALSHYRFATTSFAYVGLPTLCP
ncbi:hypothetical protein Nepgr_016905 [Nepenthes gracilis]|uniref:Uncharacterized protein n=1 Tax=Nepenthes gracilis TaxID=150966 RepID=A0AAD3SQK2_NEPGR|nr:hypothetical protein Nepgr_016905 [Nepenthes gracilis]